MGKPAITIAPLTEDLLVQAYSLAYEVWGNETDRGTAEERVMIYRYLVTHYYHPHSPFNFAAMVNGQLAGMLLAHPLSDHSTEENDFFMHRQLHPQAQELLDDYAAYLLGNDQLEEALAQPGDIILSLFVSREPGCGKCLLQSLKTCALCEGYTSLLLWTDDTCTNEYYPKHGFQLISKEPTPHPYSPNMIHTMVFRKGLQEL